MIEQLIAFLQHPESHAFTIVVGGGLVYFFFHRPLERRHDRLTKRYDKVVDATIAGISDLESTLKKLE